LLDMRHPESRAIVCKLRFHEDLLELEAHYFT
jgi:hypothetical protein